MKEEQTELLILNNGAPAVDVIVVVDAIHIRRLDRYLAGWLKGESG
jgi:hypothetical protein